MTTPTLTYLKLDNITPNGYQPRSGENTDHVKRLAAKIKLEGFKESFPLEVVKHNNSYDIVSGHHRYSAAKMLKLDTVPCSILTGSEQDLRIAACSSNDSNLSQKPVEQARAYGWLKSDGLDDKDIARAVGKSLGFVQRRLLLLKLDQSIQALVDSGNMPISLAESISELSTEYSQVKAVADIKGLELGAAQAVITSMIKAESGQVLPIFDDLSQEEQDKRTSAAKQFENKLDKLDHATGGLTNDKLELALSALSNPSKTVAHLDAIIADAKRVKTQVIEAKGLKAIGADVKLNRFNPQAVKDVRLARGMSVREFASAAGIDYSNLSAIERGKVKNPHPASLRAIATAGQVEVKSLCI